VATSGRPGFKKTSQIFQPDFIPLKYLYNPAEKFGVVGAPEFRFFSQNNFPS
jgi:hypothetical protein